MEHFSKKAGLLQCKKNRTCILNDVYIYSADYTFMHISYTRLIIFIFWLARSCTRHIVFAFVCCCFFLVRGDYCCWWFGWWCFFYFFRILIVWLVKGGECIPRVSIAHEMIMMLFCLIKYFFKFVQVVMPYFPIENNNKCQWQLVKCEKLEIPNHIWKWKWKRYTQMVSDQLVRLGIMWVESRHLNSWFSSSGGQKRYSKTEKGKSRK